VLTVDLEQLGLDQGGHLLLKRALRQAGPGNPVTVRGTAAELAVHLRAWCRSQGVAFSAPGGEGGGGTAPAAGVISQERPAGARWRGAERAGVSDPASAEGIAEHPPAHWGLAARGALVEAGAPEYAFALDRKDTVWADEAVRLYRQAVAAQWNPETEIPWQLDFTLPDEVEDAVVQVMTYLIENETAALIVPARFLGQVHPHFREVMQLLAIQTADEARHIEVFTRRATLKRRQLGLSTAGGQASLKTLLDEPDFAVAGFLLSVLGEGSFLNLLGFLDDHAPDPVTRRVAHLAAQDEARHVAFGMAHLGRHLEHEPGLRPRLAAAVERRHDALRHTAGLNEEVFDALVLLAAGGWTPAEIRSGHEAVLKLEADMAAGRSRRLRTLGFTPQQAESLSALHTRNFM